MILTLFNPLDTMTNVTLLPNDKDDNTHDTAKVEKIYISVLSTLNIIKSVVFVINA